MPDASTYFNITNRSTVLPCLLQIYPSHRKRLLRYLSRRKPCKFLLLVQLGILALLIGFFILAMLLLNKSKELCDRQCGNSAFIVLRYENSFGRKMESNCPSLIETMPVLNISSVKGKIISALEIFAVCPRCRIYSHSYKKSDNICYRQLETVREGWPEQYRICDGEVPSENKNCNPYDD